MKRRNLAIAVIVITLFALSLTLFLTLSLTNREISSSYSSTYITYSASPSTSNVFNIDVFITPHESSCYNISIKLNPNSSICNLALRVRSTKAVTIKPVVKSNVPVRYYPEREFIYPDGIFTFSFNVSNLLPGDYVCNVLLSGNYSGNCTVRLRLLVPPRIFVYPENIVCVINKTKNESVVVNNKDNLSYNISAYFERFYGDCKVKVVSPRKLLPHSKNKIFIIISGSGGGDLFLRFSNGRVNLTKVVGIRAYKMPEKPKVVEFNVSKEKAMQVVVIIKGFKGKVRLLSPKGEVKPSSIVEEIGNKNENLTYVFKVKNPEKGKWKVLIQTPFHYSVKFIKIFE